MYKRRGIGLLRNYAGELWAIDLHNENVCDGSNTVNISIVHNFHYIDSVVDKEECTRKDF